MAKKTQEELKDELTSKLTTLQRERAKLIIELDKIQKEMESTVDKIYMYDVTKTRIKCINPACLGNGWVKTEDGKKHTCPTCGGSKYNWAELFIE